MAYSGANVARRPLSLIAALACVTGGPCAVAQSFVNGDFQTGDLTGWIVQPTPNGFTLVQDVIAVDIDGPGPLGVSNAARFLVGRSGGDPQGGIDLYQPLQLDAGTTYEVAFNWAVIRDTGPSNAEGGVFSLLVNDQISHTQSNPQTSAITPKYGNIIGQFTTTTAGTYNVGVRITRNFSASIGLALHQYVDNFTIAEPASGACCLADGACQSLTLGACTVQGGTYLGANSSCATIPTCPQPAIGACCLDDGSCMSVTVFDCNAAAGVYQGDNTACAGAACPMRLRTALPTTGSASADVGVFFDLTSNQDAIDVYRFDCYPWVAAGTPVMVEVWTYPGSHIGHDTDPTGWSLHETVHAMAGGGLTPTALELTVPIMIEPSATVGVYLIAASGGLHDTHGAGTQTMFSDSRLSFFGDRARTARWGGTLQTPRVFSGTVYYAMGSGPCYANCDGSTMEPILTVDDFTCFINEFAAAQALPHQQQVTHYANCDGSTTMPALTVDDFTCFINEFAAGCP